MDNGLMAVLNFSENWRLKISEALHVASWKLFLSFYIGKSRNDCNKNINNDLVEELSSCEPLEYFMILIGRHKDEK